MHAEVARVARSCAVQLDADRFAGSGFFVAQGLIATCAHVAGSRARLTVVWQGRPFAGQVIMRRPAERGKSDYWDFPDLALVAIDDAIAHPVAMLDREPPRPGDVLRAYGFSEKTPQSGPQADGLRIVVAGEAGDYLRVKDDQIIGGLSGCLAVSDRTGLVAGMVKASRDQGNALGGWIIPSAQIRLLLSPHVTPPRFNDEWYRALVAPLHGMFEGQELTSQMLPYQLLDGPAPKLGRIYVRQQAAGSQPVDVEHAINSRRHALFIGPPGAGKSSLVQHVCYESARWWLSPEGDPPYGAAVPVRLSASALVGGGPLAEVLATRTTAELGPHLDVRLPSEAFMRPPVPGVPWLVLVDGLDEVLDVTQRLRLIEMLEKRIRSSDETWRFVITTRPLGGDELNKLLEVVGGSYLLLPFDKERVAEFARTWFEVRDPANAGERARRFLEQASAPSLADVVRVPLLATIAAIVFESQPDRGLPANAGGLYSEFIRILLSKRREVYRDGIQRRLEPFGAAGRELSDWILGNANELLTKAAHRWFFDSQMPTVDAVQDVLSSMHPSPVYESASWRHTLRTFLTETGLLVANGDRLDWLHVSFVEYLAARELVRQEDPRRWLWLASKPTTANLARFGLVEQLGRSRVPVRALRRMMRTRRGSATISDLMSSGDLLTDAEVHKLLDYALRWTTISRRLTPWSPMLYDMPWPLSRITLLDPDLQAFLSRRAGVERLRSAVASPLRSAPTRIEAAKTLLSHAEPDDRLFAARSLLTLARYRRLSGSVRVDAVRALMGGTGRPLSDQARLASEVGALALELAQRRWLTAATRLKVLAAAQDGIARPTELALLRHLLARRLTGTWRGGHGASRLMALGDRRGAEWLAWSARRCGRLALGWALLSMTLITGAGFYGSAYLAIAVVVIWPSSLIISIVTLQRSEALDTLRRAAMDQNIPDDVRSYARDELLRVKRWFAAAWVTRFAEMSKAAASWLKVKLKEANPFAARWAAARDRLSDVVISMWAAWDPEMLLEQILALYEAGQNEAAERALRQLCRRMGPIRIGLIAGYARRHARRSPRAARPLLIAVLRLRWVSPWQRRRIGRLLEVLGGRPTADA